MPDPAPPTVRRVHGIAIQPGFPAPPWRANQTLVRVVAPHFVAGCIFDATGAGRIVHTAPILHRLRGLNGDDARDYIRKQGWKATVVQERADA